MNSNDINQKVYSKIKSLEIDSNLKSNNRQTIKEPKKSEKDIYKDKIKNLEIALLEYTNELLLGVERPESYVEDLGVMFDFLDGNFENFLEEADFYMEYIKCIIDMFNLDGTKRMTFSFMTEEEEKKYPTTVVCETSIIDILKLKKDIPIKEDVLYLMKFLSNKYVKQNNYQKIKK